jgi:hypothetical protein
MRWNRYRLVGLLHPATLSTQWDGNPHSSTHLCGAMLYPIALQAKFANACLGEGEDGLSDFVRHRE